MSNIEEIGSFYRMLRDSEIRDRAALIAANDPTQQSSAELAGFASYALEGLEAEAWTSQPQAVFFRKRVGRPPREVALPAYSLLPEDGAIHLFAFHYDPTKENPEIVEQRVVERERARLEGLIEVLRGDAFDLSALKGDPAAEHLEAVREFVRSERCAVIKYFIVTNQRKSERGRAEKTIDGKVFNEVVDIDRLHRWSKGVASRSEIEVHVADILGAEKLLALCARDRNDDVTTYLTVLPARFLADMYEDWDNRLLELNVRSYLSAKGGINKGILGTLKSEEERGYFLPYNNGVVIVVEGINVENQTGAVCEIRTLKGVQIVNGGQTTASLFKARRDLKGNPLDGVYVQAKIVLINNRQRAPEIVRQISRFANSQNKVEMADLGANEAFHRRLERVAEKESDPSGTYWFYERMRNSYATQLMLETSAAARKRWQVLHPKERLITKTDLAKALMAWDRLPAVAARGGQKCFHHFAQSYHVMPIKTDEAAERAITVERFREIVAKVIVYRTTHQIVTGDKEAFTSNQVNTATYAVAYLSRRVAGELDWRLIRRNQSLTPEMKVLLKTWARRVAEYIEQASVGRLASEVCKKEGLFDQLYRAVGDLGAPGEGGQVPLEMKEFLDTGEGAPDPEDEGRILEVMALDAARLTAIRTIAEANRGVLSEHQLTVVQNLQQLAAGGWTARARPKQAKMFLKAVAKLETYGLLAEQDQAAGLDVADDGLEGPADPAGAAPVIRSEPWPEGASGE